MHNEPEIGDLVPDDNGLKPEDLTVEKIKELMQPAINRLFEFERALAASYMHNMPAVSPYPMIFDNVPDGIRSMEFLANRLAKAKKEVEEKLGHLIEWPYEPTQQDVYRVSKAVDLFREHSFFRRPAQ